ncbi:MAG: hypothetical protein QG650_880, partial [Patescibacteria group bacterium]|nr:hypothetical protein [Patescibacteria group bacterium]
GDADGFERSEPDVEREEPDGRTRFADLGNEGFGKMERGGRSRERAFFFAEFGLVIERLLVGIFDVRRKRELAVRREEIVDRSAGNDLQDPSVRNFRFDFEREVSELNLRAYGKRGAGKYQSLEPGTIRKRSRWQTSSFGNRISGTTAFPIKSRRTGIRFPSLRIVCCR